ncbi:Cna B-type domain-containing protein [Peptoniphilaceae bacterium SGI.131]
MKNKRLLLFIFLFVFMIANKNIVLAAEVSVSNEEQLKAAIENKNDIVLANDISISKTISITEYEGTIKGAGHRLTLSTVLENMFEISGVTTNVTFENIVLDGASKGRILDVDFASVTIKSATLQKGTTNNFQEKLEPLADGSGQINKQRYQGGAIYLANANLSLEDVTFSDNFTHHATPERKGLDDMVSSHGGAIYSATSNINVVGGSFNDNYSGTTVSQVGNTGEGGAIKLEGGSRLNINVGVYDKKTYFFGNHNYKTVSAVGGSQGGAIEATNSVVNINGAEFTVRGGFDTGGAIKLEGAGSETDYNTIKNSKFVLAGGVLPQIPEASGYFGTSGGAIVSENSYLTIEKSSFVMQDNPKVTYAGGHIDIVGSGAFNLYESTLSGNGYGWNSAWKASAKYGGAIAFENGASAKAHIKDTDFTGFTVDHTGGVISVGHREGNTAGLGSTSVSLLMENTSLDGARAYTWNAESAGAGMYIAEGSNVVISGGNIQNMDANYGGAIYNRGNLTLINKAAIENNGTTQMAAGIYNDGYLNAHSAVFLNNQKTNDVNFAGGNHQFSNVEHSGGTIYARKNVIIGSETTFSEGEKQDVRVIDGQSSVILSGPRTGRVNVSISETESPGGAGVYNKAFDENAHRHVGYLVARGINAEDLTAEYKQDIPDSYNPTADDAKNFHYVSKSVEAEKIAAFDDHTGTALWDYVFNPDNNTVVLGQRAKMIYHTNHSDATISDGTADANPEGQKLEQIYTFYQSGDNANPKVSVNNIAATDLTAVEVSPVLAKYDFKAWYKDSAKAKALNDIADAEKYDFEKLNFTNTWHGANPTSEITDILNFAAKNTLNTYAVYTGRISVRKNWQDPTGAILADLTGKSVTINLLRGTELVKTLTFKDNKWEGEFTDVFMQDGTGSPIKYEVKEEGEDRGSVSLDNKAYEVSYQGSSDQGFVITNKEKEEVLVSVKVTKIWKDSDGKILVDLAGKSAKVELYKNGAATGQELNLDENNAFSGEFTNLKLSDGEGKAANEYTVKEVGQKDDGTIQLGQDTYRVEIAGDMDKGYEVINTKVKVDEPKPDPDEPKPNPDEPKPNPDEPKPNPDEPKPNPDEPKPNPDEPKPNPDEPKPNPDAPKPQPKPEVKPNPEVKGGGSPKTGDFSSIMFYLVIFTLATLSLLSLKLKRKNRI